MIVYIHGFNSAPDINNAKVIALREIDKTIKFLKYDSFAPAPENLEKLRKMLNEFLGQDLQITLVGTSLGGFYAGILAKEYSLPSILINPVYEPFRQMKVFVGQPLRNYVTNEPNELSQETVSSYAGYDFDGCAVAPLLVIGMNDIIINPEKTLRLFSNKYECVVSRTSNHSFRDLVDVIPRLQSYVIFNQTNSDMNS